jgi:hypothetical protein
MIENFLMINISDLVNGLPAYKRLYTGHNAFEAAVDSPPEYTRPPLAKYNKLPFLEQFIDFCSTFLLENLTKDLPRALHPYLVRII